MKEWAEKEAEKIVDAFVADEAPDDLRRLHTAIADRLRFAYESGRLCKKEKVLLIDDDGQMRRMLATALAAEGYEVVEASNGKEALALYAHSPCDVIITDILMPEKDGLETIQALRRRAPRVKIVAYSGGEVRMGFDILEVAKQFGATATLQKPFPLQEIVQLLKGLPE